MSMQPKDVVERYLAEVLNGEGQARPEDLISGQTLRQRTTGFRRAFPDLKVTTHTLLVDGDLVAAHFTGRGTHQGLFQGVPATGRGWQADCIAVLRAAAGPLANRCHRAASPSSAPRQLIDRRQPCPNSQAC
jgi:SnoaL-like polyketide cyclase